MLIQNLIVTLNQNDPINHIYKRGISEVVPTNVTDKDVKTQIDLSQPDDHTPDTMGRSRCNNESRIIKENLFIDSKTYNDLSPSMKDLVKDVFKFVEEQRAS